MTIHFNPHKRVANMPEDKYTCIYCGKELKSAAGKKNHEKACEDNPDNSLEGGE
jgi:NifB/MoaA-like Fe-S oxidoreductase